MITSIRTISVLALAVLGGCGGSRAIGNEPACGLDRTCPTGDTCDVDGLCRELCGANAPGTNCAAGTQCVSYVCRPTCTSNAGCPSGFICGQGVCLRSACSSDVACPVREACVSGACQPIGQLCPTGTACTGASEICDQGVCRIQCGANYPGNYCASGNACQNGVCR